MHIFLARPNGVIKVYLLDTDRIDVSRFTEFYDLDNQFVEYLSHSEALDRLKGIE